MRSITNVLRTRRGDSSRRALSTLLLTLILIILTFSGSLTLAQAAAPVINEFSHNTAGTDVEYIEIYGDPNTDYSAFTVLELEGDSGTSAGTIDHVIAVGATNAEGLTLINLAANDLENGTITLLLVEGFTGSLNTDLDSNNDGVFDTTPWTTIVDGVAVNDGGADDLTYTPVVLTVSYDGLPFAPGGASRIPDGTDTDTTADWVRNDFDLLGIPGFAGTPVLGEAVNTPGASNQAIVPDPTKLVINEIDYDQVGTDGAEYVELTNNGFLTVDMTGLEVRFVNGASGGAAVYTTLSLNGFSLAPGDYFVVCANALIVTACDLDAPGSATDFIQNGAPDAVALAFAGGAVIDTVSYEGSTSGGYTEGTGVSTGKADSNTVADIGLSRFVDGNDTGNNDTDFVLSCITAGEENTDVVPPCSAPNFDFVHNIQTSGDTAAPGTFTVEAIVVADFQLDAQLDGFFIQEEDSDADALTSTSEGMFVFCAACPVAVEVGDKVQVTGPSSEFFGMSQLSATTAGSIMVMASDQALPTPAALDLPVPGGPFADLASATAAINAYYEQYEGMLVRFADTLTVSEYFELARYGQLILTEGGRPRQFTDTSIPTEAGYTAHLIDLARRTMILDDDDNAQNSTPLSGGAFYHPIPGFSTSNFVRGGDTINNLTGVLHWSFAGFSGTDAWRIRPVVEEPSFNYAFTPQNPRTATPDPVGGTLKVASFNVLNYFDTLDDDTTDDDSNDVCGPVGGMDCRGADSPAELARQGAKIAAAVCAIDADVYGLIEIENDASGALTSLVNAINSVPNCGPYTYVNPNGTIGTDAITTAFIYNPATVSPVGDFAALTDAAFTDPTGAGIQRNRPALAQTFSQDATGAVLTVVVNHFKSKGSGCGAGDDDTTMGQGNCTLTRTLAAQALVNWLATDPTGSGDPDFLIIGDLNSYRNEAPIVALENGGFTDLNELFGGASAYSYVFDGQIGYLDYALANASLTPQVTGVTEWHINADEAPVLDYNDEIRDAGEEAFEEEPDGLPLYEANAYRASDHDPVIVGLNLTFPLPEYTLTVNVSPAEGGAVAVSPEQPTYNPGDVVTLEAVANPGYTFTGWTGDMADTGSASTTITIDEDEIVTANFVLEAYTLTVNVSPTEGGAVAINPDQETYTYGDVVTLEAVANPDYVFTGWTGDVADTSSASTTITIDEDETVTANFAPVEVEGVVGLSLVDSKEDEIIDAFDPLVDGAVININEVGKRLNILANTNPEEVGSVKFVLTGRQRHTEIENHAPYLLFSDQNGNFFDWPHGGPDTGDYTLTVTAYERSNGRGAVIGEPLTISFKIVKGPKPPVVVSSFTLINAKTDQDVAEFNPLPNNTTIDLAVVGRRLNIRANATPSNVGRVTFKLTGPQNRTWTEFIAPYALFSNVGGNYLDWFPRTGTYTLTATPYEKFGAPGTPLTITFTIVNSQPLFVSELVTDGGFEAVSEWTIRPGGDVRFRCNATEAPADASEQVSAAGTCAMQLRGTTDGIARVERIILGDQLATGQTLTLSAQVAGHGLKAKSAQIVAIVRYVDGSKETLRIPLKKGSYAYTPVSKTLTLKGAVQDVRLRVNYAAKSGRLLVDGLSLKVDGDTSLIEPGTDDVQLRR